MKKINLLMLSCMFFLSLISLSSATTTCETQLINLDSLNMQYSMVCSNNDNVTVFLSSTLSNVLVSPTSISPFDNPTITFIALPNTPPEDYQGQITFTDGSPNIPLYLSIEEADPTACRLNPSLVYYNQPVQQGTEFELPKITFNPTNCQGEFSIDSAFVAGGIITSEGQKPVYLKSSSSTEITLGVSTIGLSSLTYNSKLTLTAFGKTFSDISIINIIVTGGTNPSGVFNADVLPTCSLSNSVLLLNESYALTCSNLVTDVSIEPEFDFNYIKGTGTEITSNQFIWYFTPKKLGETFIMADFKYLGVSVGDPFFQEVKIQSSGYSGVGTSLKFIFTPKLDQATGEEESYLIQIVDNSSGSLVPNARLWVNAIELNSSTDTFQYPFEPNKDYELRGKATNYDDIVQTIKINPSIINIIITPGTGDTLTTFSVNTSVSNATITIGGVDYFGFYLGILPGGVNEIKAVKEGYKTEIINFTVDDRIKILSFGGEFKKGIDQNFTLNKNVSWVVYHKKSMDDVERTEIAKGTGDLVLFLPDKKGIYVIEAEGMHIGTYEIPGFSFKNKWWIFPAWMWLLFGGILAIVIIIVIVRKRAQGSYDTGQQDGAGLSFNVGDEP